MIKDTEKEEKSTPAHVRPGVIDQQSLACIFPCRRMRRPVSSAFQSLFLFYFFFLFFFLLHLSTCPIVVSGHAALAIMRTPRSS